MKGNRAVLTAVVVVVLLVAGWWLFSGAAAASRIDLLATLPTAEKRPAGGTFDVDRRGPRRRQRSARSCTVPTSRIIWRLTVPDDGWLRVALGDEAGGLDKEGDGVLFRIGVSDGRAFEELFAQHVDPFAQQGRPPLDPR